jgi:hypothetical protein
MAVGLKYWRLYVQNVPMLLKEVLPLNQTFKLDGSIYTYYEHIETYISKLIKVLRVMWIKAMFGLMECDEVGWNVMVNNYVPLFGFAKTKWNGMVFHLIPSNPPLFIPPNLGCIQWNEIL